MNETTANPKTLTITRDDIIGVLQSATQTQYNARDLHTKNATIEVNVSSLFGQDYEYQLIANNNGELSLYYPRRILIPTVNKWSDDHTPKISPSVDIRDHFVRSRIARCRSRFVVPAILVDDKYICRSSTVASWGEVYSRSGVDRFIDTPTRIPNQFIIDTPLNPPTVATDLDDPPTNAIVGAEAAASSSVGAPQQQNIFDKLRGADIDLLKVLDVDAIANLMVEKRKIMFGVNVTSSENSDKEQRYRDFQLLIIPYPGCEHFRDFSTQDYNAETMFYDWTLPLNDSSFQVPPHLAARVQADWSFWKSWNSVELTKNYIRLLLRHLETDDHGLLVHCISGWDRTPLFISLLRLSLWADGWIHQSLTVEEMLYLTLAYDWYLFGHCLPERLERGEEIMYFAFMILPHLVTDDFVYKYSNNPPISQSNKVSDCTESIYSISTLTHLNDPVDLSSASPSSESDEIVSLPNSTDSSTAKSVREDKLLSLSRLFHICYRAVIPNRPPTMTTTGNLLPNSLGSFNPRPIGREIARSINNFIGQWRTQPR